MHSIQKHNMSHELSELVGFGQKRLAVEDLGKEVGGTKGWWHVPLGGPAAAAPGRADNHVIFHTEDDVTNQERLITTTSTRRNV